MVHLSEEERWAIVAAWKASNSISITSRTVGRSYGVVQRWVQRYQETGGINHHVSSGRPRALQGEAAEKAEELLLAEGCSGAESVARELLAQGFTSKKVHKTTVIRAAVRAAKAKGTPIHAVRGVPAKRLTVDTKNKRLAFAAANKSRSWANVMFTDRKKFLFRFPG